MTWVSWVSGGTCVLAFVFLAKTMHDFWGAERRLAELQRQQAIEKAAAQTQAVVDTRMRQSPFVSTRDLYEFSLEPLNTTEPMDFPFISNGPPAPTTPKQRVLLSDLLKNLEKATPDRANQFTPPRKF